MPGFAEFIASVRPAPEERGSPLAQVLARAAQAGDRQPEPEDPDDRLAPLLTRGYYPGLMIQLSQRLGDTCAELEAEQEKIARGARRAAVVRREHEAGRVNVWAMQEMLDGDFGDEARARQLERRAASLRSQIARASAMIAPQQEQLTDPLEQASRHAHQVFREVTRQRMAEAEAGRTERRPFASGGGAAVRSEQPVTCPHCIRYGATAGESFLIHQDPSPLKPPAAVSEAEQDWLSDREAGRGSWPARYDTSGRLITR